MLSIIWTVIFIISVTGAGVIFCASNTKHPVSKAYSRVLGE